jgi:thiosulfate dehydrogenase
MRRSVLAVIALVSLVYGGMVVFGLHVRDESRWSEIPSFGDATALLRKPAWTPPSMASIPNGAKGDSIRLGLRLFNETQLYARDHVSAKISCSGCHAEGGMQPYASPMVGVEATFPQFNARAGHVISLEDRIQECFVRSENGRPIDYKGVPMRALVDYIEWVSTAEPARKPFVGRGLLAIRDMTPDVDRGKAIYAEQCAGCHGENGEGRPNVFPPLWGPDSFNDGAGMHGVKKMAAFVQHNMPQNRMGILTPQEAWDVAAYVHQQPRPPFNKAYARY